MKFDGREIASLCLDPVRGWRYRVQAGTSGLEVAMILVVVGAAAYFAWVRPPMFGRWQAAALPPADVRLRRAKRAALIVISIFLVLAAAALMVATEGMIYAAADRATARWVVAGGALALLAAFWSPWAGLRIAASLTLVAVTLVASLVVLFIAAGGPDSRAESLPAVGVICGIALLVFLLPFVVLFCAEFLLWRMGRSGSKRAAHPR